MAQVRSAPVSGDRFNGLSKTFETQTGLRVRFAKHWGDIEHRITHHQLKISILSGTLLSSTGRAPENTRRISPSQIKRLSGSSILSKALLQAEAL